MESGRLWASIARHWLLSSIVLVLVLAAAVAAAFLPQRTYESSATFGLFPEAPANSSSGDLTQLANSLMGNYLAQIDSKTTEAAVRAGLTGAAATASWSVRGENDPGTMVLRIHVTSHDAAVVAPVANKYSQVIRAYAGTPAGVNPRVIDEARAPTAPIAPNRALILVAGAILAVVLACCAALLAGNKPRRNRGRQAPRPTAGPPAVMPQELPTPMESVRTAEPIRG
jgi:uncharacterized protein involved in exopolysaccharide biosynthesis